MFFASAGSWFRGARRGQAEPHHTRLSAAARGAVQLVHAVRCGARNCRNSRPGALEHGRARLFCARVVPLPAWDEPLSARAPPDQASRACSSRSSRRTRRRSRRRRRGSGSGDAEPKRSPSRGRAAAAAKRAIPCVPRVAVMLSSTAGELAQRGGQASAKQASKPRPRPRSRKKARGGQSRRARGRSTAAKKQEKHGAQGSAGTKARGAAPKSGAADTGSRRATAARTAGGTSGLGRTAPSARHSRAGGGTGSSSAGRGAGSADDSGARGSVAPRGARSRPAASGAWRGVKIVDCRPSYDAKGRPIRSPRETVNNG